MQVDVSPKTYVGSERYQNYLPELVQRWDGDASSADHRLIEGTMVLADISGFTAMSERLSKFGKVGAEEVTDVLGECFKSLLAVAYPLGGGLIKFGGDALLLIFDGDGHEGRAVNAAAGMQEVMRRIGRVSTSAGVITLRMSIGAHSGPFHFFLAGESHRELILTGPAATRVVEMEAAAEATEIVVSAETAAALPTESVGDPKGPGFLVRQAAPGVGDALVDVRPAPQDLERYIPVAIRKSILAGVTEPEHRQVTVAFLHFMGVDSLLSTRGPDAVAVALQDLVGRVQRAVDPRRVAFLATDAYDDGGKIILAAGAPIATGNDSERMLLALREIVAGQGTLPVRIGVNRGHVFAGDVGPSYRRTFTIMGDDVNLAARLMAAARPGEIYATPVVLNNSRTLFDIETLPPFQVKGKAEPVEACAVGEETGTRAVRIREDLPFLGRDRELATLVDALQRTRAGKGGLLAVAGERGIGKTRLVREALAAVPEVPSIVVRSEPYGTATPYRPFRDPIREVLGIERADHDTMARKLTERVGLLDPELLPLLPLIGDVAHVDLPETPEVAAIDPQFRRGRLADLIVGVLERSRPGPLAFIFEEAHWMDDASAELSARLGAATADHPWLVVATRMTDQQGGLSLKDAPAVNLMPLTPGDAEAVVVAATAESPLRSHDMAAIVQRAGGNPLFLDEILKAVAGRGATTELPDSLDALVTAQIDALDPLSRQLLRYASVLGSSFRLTVLNEILRDELVALDSAARDSLASFLEPDEADRMRFRHALLRDTAYEGLSYKKRRELHSRAAHAIEHLAGRHPETAADVLALHYSLAQEHRRAWNYARIAGDQAKEAYANVDAATQYERALASAARLPEVSAPDKAALWESLGDVREQAGLYEGALEAFRRASRLSGKDPVARAGLLLKRARARMVTGNYSVALAEITKGLHMLEVDDSPPAARARARLTSFRAVIRMNQQRPDDALAVAERAVEEARAADEDEALARAYVVLDWANFLIGNPDRAVHSRDALAIYERLGLLALAADVLNNLGVMAYFDGRWDDAVDLYRRAHDTYTRAGNEVGAAFAGENIGELLVSQGRLDEAEPILAEAARVARASGVTDVAIFAEIQMARLLGERGKEASAVTLLQELGAQASTVGLAGLAFEAALHQASLRARHGDAREALALIETAEAAAGQGAAVHASTVSRLRATALARLGRLEDALAEIDKGMDHALRQGLLYEQALLLSLGHAMDPRTGSAPKASADAEALFARLGVRR